MRRTPVLIVGGGPAGSAAAITLARGGLTPELVERTSGPHDIVCGGFLGWDALAALRQLGIDMAALGARPITRLRIVSGAHVVDAELPHRAAGLSRRTLDTAMLAAAAAAGTNVMRGRSARAGDPEAIGVRFDDGEEVACEALFLATGKHELRGVARPIEGRREAPAAGLRASLPASAARERSLAGFIELHLFDGGYAGLLLQEDGTANLCISVARGRLAAAGGPLPLVAEIVAEAPLLGKRIGADLPAAWEAVAGVPYGWRAERTQPGLFRIGDQGAVIASLAGDGIAMALTSGVGAAKTMLSGGADAAPGWQQHFHRLSARPIKVAEALRHGAERGDARNALMTLLKLMPGLAAFGARLTRIGAD